MLNLFVLSLVPFTTAAMGENNFKAITVTVYASLLSLSIVVYLLLVNQLCKLHGKKSSFPMQYKGHRKTYISLGLNILAVLTSMLNFPKIAFILLFLISIAWFIPNHVFDPNPKFLSKNSE